MKLSNKLLIILAILCFAIPLSIVIIDNIGGINAQEYYSNIDKESQNYAVKSKYLNQQSLHEFKTVRIKSTNNIGVRLHLIHENTFGIKSTLDSNQFKISNLADELEIEIKDDHVFEPYNIYLYAPDFNNIKISNINLFDLITSKDSLALEIENSIYALNINGNSNLKKLKLNLINANIPNMMNIEHVEHLYLQLQNSDVKASAQMFSSLDLQADNSIIEIFEGEGTTNNNEGILKNIKINTNGKSVLNFPKTLTNFNIEGNLSDSTSTNLPIVELKNLIK